MKAQVTLFVILGIIILIAGALVFYFKEKVSFQPEYIEPRFEPIQNYVQSCLADISKEAVTLIGLNGGYITFPNAVQYNPNSYLSIGPVKDLRNPYWWYDGISAIPTEEFINMQLENYITEQLRICTANFTTFQNDFNIEQGNIQTSVDLTENSVDIKVNFPLTITDRSDNNQIKMSKFFDIEHVRLKKAYELAKAIMLKENEDMFLEKKTIDLIALDKDIPYTDVQVSCKKKTWSIAKLKSNLQNLLAINLPYIRIRGTSYKDTYVPTPDGGVKYSTSYYQQHYLWDVSETKYEGMHTSFGYDKLYPMRFSVRPNKGSYIESNSQKGQNMLSFFCLQIWHFTYDIVYPVKATIYDEKTNDHDEYTFIFAFKVSLNHNQPFRENFATTIFEGRDTADNDEYCNEAGKQIFITTWDNVTDEPIPRANLTFVCGIFSCDIGSTEWIDYGAAAGVTKNLPYCVYGFLKAKAENYEEAQLILSTGKDATYEMYMTPTKTITDFEVVKHKYNNGLIGEEEPLASDQTASIMITMVNSTFSSYAVYPSDGGPITLLAEKDYTYQLQVYIVQGEDITGGYIADWPVSWYDLAGANKIKIHVLEPDPIPQDEDGKSLFIAGLPSYSAKANKPPELIVE